MVKVKLDAWSRAHTIGMEIVLQNILLPPILSQTIRKLHAHSIQKVSN